jgi:hypothetical protein
VKESKIKYTQTHTHTHTHIYIYIFVKAYAVSSHVKEKKFTVLMFIGPFIIVIVEE